MCVITLAFLPSKFFRKSLANRKNIIMPSSYVSTRQVTKFILASSLHKSLSVHRRLIILPRIDTRPGLLKHTSTPIPSEFLPTHAVAIVRGLTSFIFSETNAVWRTDFLRRRNTTQTRATTRTQSPTRSSPLGRTETSHRVELR